MAYNRIQKCALLIGKDGTIKYYDWDDPTKLLVEVGANCMYEDVHDLRNPPYTQILPCPYCSTLNDRDHDLSLHINIKLGK